MWTSFAITPNIHMAKRFIFNHGRMADLRNASQRADVLKHVAVYLGSIYGHLENKGAVMTQLANISGDVKGEQSDSPHHLGGDSETFADIAVGNHEDEEEVLPEIGFSSAKSDLSAELSYTKPEPSLRAIHIQGAEENYPHPWIVSSRRAHVTWAYAVIGVGSINNGIGPSDHAPFER